MIGSLSIAGWALYEKSESEKMMLSMTYLNAVSSATTEAKILSYLREGRSSVAIDRLEQALSAHEATLIGCKNDYCSQSNPEEVALALQAISGYRSKYKAK